MRIRLSAERCVGHGRCYVLAPDVYEEDDEGRCILREAEVPRELEDAARVGASNCPEAALSIDDA